MKVNEKKVNEKKVNEKKVNEMKVNEKKVNEKYVYSVVILVMFIKNKSKKLDFLVLKFVAKTCRLQVTKTMLSIAQQIIKR